MIEPPTYDEARAALSAIEHVCPEGIARLSWTIVSDWMDYAQEGIGGYTALVSEMEEDLSACEADKGSLFVEGGLHHLLSSPGGMDPYDVVKEARKMVEALLDEAAWVQLEARWAKRDEEGS